MVASFLMLEIYGGLSWTDPTHRNVYLCYKVHLMYLYERLLISLIVKLLYYVTLIYCSCLYRSFGARNSQHMRWNYYYFCIYVVILYIVSSVHEIMYQSGNFYLINSFIGRRMLSSRTDDTHSTTYVYVTLLNSKLEGKNWFT